MLLLLLLLQATPLLPPPFFAAATFVVKGCVFVVVFRPLDAKLGWFTRLPLLLPHDHHSPSGLLLLDDRRRAGGAWVREGAAMTADAVVDSLDGAVWLLRDVEVAQHVNSRVRLDVRTDG